MKRADALRAIRGAGTDGDQAAFLRLYVENRISYSVALAEYRRGAAFAAAIRSRDRAAEIMAEHRDNLGRDGVRSL